MKNDLFTIIIVTIYFINYNTINFFSVETYLSPVETHCMNVDYFFLDPENHTHEFSEDAMTRLRMFKQITIIDNCLQFKN